MFFRIFSATEVHAFFVINNLALFENVKQPCRSLDGLSWSHTVLACCVFAELVNLSSGNLGITPLCREPSHFFIGNDVILVEMRRGLVLGLHRLNGWCSLRCSVSLT